MYDQVTAAPPELDEVRCPQCGGLNRVGAEWCGQCLERFVPPKPPEIRGGTAGGGPPPPPPPPESLQPQAGISELSQIEPPTAAAPASSSPAGGKAFLVGADGINWACKHCETVNSIETDVCSVCGMAFADLLRPVAPERPKRDPNTVALISLFWPGAGHGYIGQWGQAISRAVVSLLVLVVAGLSFAQTGLGAMTTIFSLISFVFWAVTAHDSFQEASNAPSRVVVKGRSMLWLVMGILVLLMGIMVIEGLQANAAVG
jgi:RNA polymerase subunit RPABC4/transcription elongation factor Spt4